MKILAINGMGNYPYIQTQLVKPTLSVAWDQTPPTADWDIIIGHSLGGHRALELAALWKPKLLLHA